MGSRYRSENKVKLNVLVAEDDAFQRIAISDLLNLCDFEVTDCEDGIKARDELLKVDNNFDMLLIDVIMPEMNGLELLKQIKQIDRLKDIPVFMMSSDGENDIVATCLSFGAKDYLVKPVGYQHLKGLKEKVLSYQLPKKHVDNERPYYTHVRNLGRGAAGSVELVRRSTDNELFAMKVIPMHFMNENERKNAENEVHLLRVLVGPTIIRYYESFTEHDSINIIMEYAEGGSLYDVIQQQKQTGKKFDRDQILYWLAQMVIAIQFMHQRNVLHRDIKTQNMFLKKNIIKIGDFGISKSLGTHNDFARTFLGTPYFMPPEVCKGEPYGCKADVWALGCALYELVTFKRPFQHDLIQMVFDLIIKHPYDAIDPSIDKDLVMLIDKMLQKDPSKRPSIWELGKIPCIEEKTQLFYKEHPQESTPVMAGKDEVEETRASLNTKQEDDLEELAFKICEDAQFQKHYVGKIQYNVYPGISGHELWEWMKKNQTWKNDDQIRDSLKQMIVDKVLLPIGNSNPNEFSNSNDALYCFSRLHPNMAANMTRVFQGDTKDGFETLSLCLTQCKKIQQIFGEMQPLNKDAKDKLVQEVVSLKKLANQMQKIKIETTSQDSSLAFFLNLYQLMRFHCVLKQQLQSLFPLKLLNLGPGFAKRLLQIVLPFYAGEITEKQFSYNISGQDFTIDQVKSGILRGNKRSPNGQFSPWPVTDIKHQYVIKTNPFIVVLFVEDQDQKNKSLSTIEIPIEIFTEKTVQSRLEQIIERWVRTNVQIDLIENEISINSLLKFYIQDFGGDDINLLTAIFKYINQRVDKNELIRDVKEQKIYISYQDNQS